MVDNSECSAITVTKKRLKTNKTIFLNQGSAFKPAKFTFDFYFCLPEQEALKNLKKKHFSDIRGFLEMNLKIQLLGPIPDCQFKLYKE